MTLQHCYDKVTCAAIVAANSTTFTHLKLHWQWFLDLLLTPVITMTTEIQTSTYLQKELPELVIASHTTAACIATGEERSHVFHVLTQLGADLLQNHLQVALGELPNLTNEVGLVKGVPPTRKGRISYRSKVITQLWMELLTGVESVHMGGVADRCKVNTYVWSCWQACSQYIWVELLAGGESVHKKGVVDRCGVSTFG